MILSGRLNCLEWAVATAPRVGETRSGDLHVVQELPRGALVAVLDGLGHGDDAALAAERASEAIMANCDRNLSVLVHHCHAALLKTRGVVMGLAQFDFLNHTLSWLVVGNIEGMLLHEPGAVERDRAAVMRGGVVGHRLPALHASMLPVALGDVLIFATDGIRKEFRSSLDTKQSPHDLARQVLDRFRYDTDDALVLVARYLGADSCERLNSSTG